MLELADKCASFSVEKKNHSKKNTAATVNESRATSHWKHDERRKKNSAIEYKEKLWSNENLNKAMIWSSLNDTFLCRYFCMWFGFSKLILMEFFLIISTTGCWVFDYSLLSTSSSSSSSTLSVSCIQSYSLLNVFLFLNGLIVTCVLIGTSSINFNLCHVTKGLLHKGLFACHWEKKMWYYKKKRMCKTTI